jgi:hypothetical protein
MAARGNKLAAEPNKKLHFLVKHLALAKNIR